MAGRKSYIEIGWKLDESGLKKANQLTDQAIEKSKQRVKAMKDSVSAEEQVSKQVKQTNTEMSRTGHLAGLIGKNLKTNFGTFENASKSLKTAGNHLESAGRSTRTASLAVGAGLAYSAKQAMDLQQKFKETSNLLVNGGEKQKEVQRNVNQMTQDGAKYSMQYGKSQKSIADGYEELVKRGYTSNQALGAQKSLLQASIASGDSYSDVVHNATATLESFGMRAKSTSGMIHNTKEVTNQMAYAADATATDFSSMGLAMTYAGATAHQSGLSLHETASAIGILSNNGLEADKAGTGLRKTLSSLQSPTKAGQGALDELGLSVKDFTDKSGNMKSMTDIFGLLNKHAENMKGMEKAQIFHALFGATGQQAATILSDNAKALGELDEKVKDSTANNYVQNIANKNMGTAKMQLARFKQASTAVGIDLAKEALPALTELATKATVLLEKFDKLPKGTKSFATNATLAVVALSPMLAITGHLAKDIGYITEGLGKLKNLGSVQDSMPTFEAPEISVKPNTPFYKGTKHLPDGSSTVATTSVPKSVKATATKINWSGLAKSNVLKTAAWAGVGIDVGTNIANAARDGLDTKKGGREMWKAGGTAIGAAVGSTLGPLGTAVGGSIGNAAATAIANSDFAKKLQKDGFVKAVKETGSVSDKEKKKTDKTNGLTTSSLNGGGGSFATPGDDTVRTVWKPKSKPITKGLSKSDKNYYNDAIELENNASASLVKSAGKATKGVKDAFDSLYTLVKDKSDKRLKNEKTNLDYLQKQGIISSKDAKKQYEDAKTSSSTRLKNLKSQLNDVMTSDKLTGTKRVDAINSINKQILSLTDAGAQKQQTLLKRMNTKTSHLSTEQFGSVLTASNKAYRSTVKNANKSYTTQVSEANKRYRAEKKAANSLKGLSENQRAAIIKKARNQRDKTISNAETQRDQTIQAAKDQKDRVIDEAQKQADGVANAFTTLASDVTKSIPSLIDQNMSAFGGHLTKAKTDDESIIDNYNVGSKLSKADPKKGGKLKTPTTYFGKASGGPISRTQMALVGEEGHELAYNPRTGRVRILGGNGAVMDKVYAGEHILNARDTSKVLNGNGIGAGKVLKGYASGTASLTVASYAGGTTKAKSTTPSTKSLSTFNKKSKSLWSKTEKDTDKSTGKIRKNSNKDYKGLASDLNKTTKNMHKSLNKDWDGITDDFKATFGKLDNYAHSAMKGAIKQLNGGITGIDTVLGKFGGNNSVLPLIHYAQGTQGPISKHTMAVVNDAKSGPRQEAIIRNGHALMPQGNDVVLPLQPNDEVLNGHEVQSLQDVGALPHFAKGTGALKRLAKSNNGDPSKAFTNDFSKQVGKGNGTTLGNAVMGLGSRSSNSLGKPWYGAMWNVITGAMSGGSAAGGNWLHSPGSGWSHTDVFGSPRSGGVHDGNDYSAGQGTVISAVHGGKVVRAAMPPSGWGPVGYSIITKGDDGQYVMYQEFGSAKNAKVSVGDTVRTGQTIGTLGNSGLGTGPHLHIGVSRNYPFSNNGMSTKGWEDLTKMKGGSSGTAKKASKDTKLEKLAKAELGKSALSWISKNLSDSDGLGSLSGGVGLGGGVSSRARSLAAAIKQLYPSATNAGIAAVLGNWSFESGLNPSARNASGGASGLGQWLGGRFSNLQRFAKKHGSSWTDPATQLKFALTSEGSDSALLKKVLSGKGSVASLAAQFSNGWERGGYTAQHVAGARKIASALKYAKGGKPPVGQDVLVGEKGPELARFTQPATIYSNAKSADMIKRGKGNSITGAGSKNVFNVNVTVNAGNIKDSDQLSKKVANEVMDKLKVAVQSANDEL